MKKKIKKFTKKKKFIFVFWIVLIVVGLVLGVYFGFKEKGIKKEVFDLENFREVEVKVGPGIVFLVDKEEKCKVLPVYVSLEQSRAIGEGVENITEERPGTHELMANILGELGVEVKAVKIVELKEGTYFAELVLEKEGEVFKVDSRPSDAIAIGLRMGSKVYVKEELMGEAGVDICREYAGERKGLEEIKEML